MIDTGHRLNMTDPTWAEGLMGTKRPRDERRTDGDVEADRQEREDGGRGTPGASLPSACLPSLADIWVGSLAESALCSGLMVQDDEPLLKAADGRIRSPGNQMSTRANGE